MADAKSVWSLRKIVESCEGWLWPTLLLRPAQRSGLLCFSDQRNALAYSASQTSEHSLGYSASQTSEHSLGYSAS